MRARWVELAGGVFARRYAELDLTIGLVLGRQRCLVIDTRGDAEQGAELAAAVRELTALPWTLAVTHAHFDHCFGAAPFLPCPVWAHSGYPAAVEATAQAQRTHWVAHYVDVGDLATAGALAAAAPAEADQLVDVVAELDLGDRLVRLAHLGRGHTDHDLVVQVPDTGVVFAGDLVEQGADPDFTDADPTSWPGTLDALLELGGSVVVPGHGEPVLPVFVAAQRDGLALVGRLYAAVASGALTAEDATAHSPYRGVHWPARADGG